MQNRQPPREEQIVNQQRSTCRHNAINIKGIDTLPVNARVKSRPLVEVLIEDVEKEDDLEVVVHQQEGDSDAFAEECEFNGYIRTAGVTNITPSVDKAQFGVVRCTLA